MQATSHEVLVNVCDQVVERSSKILTQRSKPGASDHITVQELQDISLFSDILNAETHAMTGKTITGKGDNRKLVSPEEIVRKL